MADMFLVIAYRIVDEKEPAAARFALRGKTEAHVGDPIDLPPEAWQRIAFAAKMEFACQCKRATRRKRQKTPA